MTTPIGGFAGPQAVNPMAPAAPLSAPVAAPVNPAVQSAPSIQGPAVPAGALAGGVNAPPVAEESAPKERKPRVPRVKYLSDGAPKLTSGVIPADYGKKHLPLSKDDFADEALYYDYRANTSRALAEKFDKEAAEIRSGGSKEDRKTKKKFTKAAGDFFGMMETMKAALGEDAFNKLVAEAQANNATAAAAGV